LALRVYGEKFDTSDAALTIPRIYQKTRINKDFVLKALRTHIVIYGSPVFTQLEMRIYSDKAGSPLRLIHTFDKIWTLAELSALPYAYKEIYFDFSTSRFLKGLDYYHFALWPTGYTGTSESHIAWVRGYPDPNNTIDVTLSPSKISTVPFYMGFIGGEV
jgi:hypothetical protein